MATSPNTQTTTPTYNRLWDTRDISTPDVGPLDMLKVVREWTLRMPDKVKIAVLNDPNAPPRPRLAHVVFPSLTTAEIRVFQDPEEAEEWVIT